MNDLYNYGIVRLGSNLLTGRAYSEPIGSKAFDSDSWSPQPLVIALRLLFRSQ
jgi:hypothetical protein